jgi:hypothetical protein
VFPSSPRQPHPQAATSQPTRTNNPEEWDSTEHLGLDYIACIGPEINIKISAKDPMSYIEKYKITPEKLKQQFIDPASLSLSHEGYEAWLFERAKRLAEVGNEFLAELKPPVLAETCDHQIDDLLEPASAEEQPM